MDRETLLNNLRKLYIKKDFKEFKRVYLLGKWILTNEDREKIEKNVYISQNNPLVEFCIKELGYKKIDKIP